MECDRVYAIARDGFLIQKVLEIVAVPKCPTRYLRVSRRATALPSVRGFGMREVELARAQPGRAGVRGLLRAFNLDDAELLDIARAKAGDLEAPLDDRAIQPLLSDPGFQARIAERSENARRRLQRYLAREEFTKPGRVALLDVGWSGTIQSNLERALDGKPEMHGLYLGLYSDGARKEGLLYDYRRSGLRERAPLHFVQIFELSARAPEGMTIDYSENGEPIAREHEAERAAEPAIAELQTGILDCARAGAEFSVDEIKDRIERFIFLPTREELSALSELRHADDWARAAHGPLTGHANIPNAILNPRQWLNNFYESYWKPAFLVESAGPLAARAFHLWENLKARINRPGR